MGARRRWSAARGKKRHPPCLSAGGGGARRASQAETPAETQPFSSKRPLAAVGAAEGASEEAGAPGGVPGAREARTGIAPSTPAASRRTVSPRACRARAWCVGARPSHGARALTALVRAAAARRSPARRGSDVRANYSGGRAQAQECRRGVRGRDTPAGQLERPTAGDASPAVGPAPMGRQVPCGKRLLPRGARRRCRLGAAAAVQRLCAVVLLSGHQTKRLHAIWS
jgi:hypothetical protein